MNNKLITCTSSFSLLLDASFMPAINTEVYASRDLDHSNRSGTELALSVRYRLYVCTNSALCAQIAC